MYADGTTAHGQPVFVSDEAVEAGIAADALAVTYDVRRFVCPVIRLSSPRHSNAHAAHTLAACAFATACHDLSPLVSGHTLEDPEDVLLWWAYPLGHAAPRRREGQATVDVIAQAIADAR